MDEALLKNLIVFAAVFSGSAVGFFICRKIALTALERWARATSTEFDDLMIRSISRPSILWVLSISLYIALGTSHFQPKYVDYGLKVLYLLIVASMTVVATTLSRRLVDYYAARTGAALPAAGLIAAVIKGFVLLVGFLIALAGLGISITPILTALGVGGLAVALALQDTLSNLFAGIHILVERAVRVGDYIRLEGGEEGYVEDIGWRTIRIRKLQNNIVIIPNKMFSQSVITNFMLPEKTMALLLSVGVSYDCDPDKVEKILFEEARGAVGEIKGLLSAPEPSVRFIPGFGDFALGFTLICHIAEYTDQYHIQHELRKRIFKRFKKEGITIPFPTRTVHLKQ